MLRNGSYSAWFRTPQGEGTGIVELNDGQLTGGDTVIGYDGSYTQDGDSFTAGNDLADFSAQANGKDTGEPQAHRFISNLGKATRPLVDYYSEWAKSGTPGAPKYRKISGTGTVDEITSRALQALV